MELNAFVERARALTPVGYEFENPGGGSSRILSSGRDKLGYRRGRSAIFVRWAVLHEAFVRFAGERVSSSDLRQSMPSVFDSNARPAGHSCNCTLLFHLLEKLSLTIGQMGGRGVRGDPFWIRLKTLDACEDAFCQRVREELGGRHEDADW